ncbi:MAG: thioredoxin domain-containing protein [Chloroflexi bacterium]|nr:MAG: thioredoxin domain-containing protein [Chloroflexota bacterium]
MSNSQKMSHTNRLINEISPYLLQHAQNPVDWYSWGEEALTKAKTENKPIFLSIGYSACHWCHRMREESFEDSETAAFMNEHFVSIKVDREERPDIDAIYMQATVAMTGSGGWPMSVFLTPDLRPFYAGTYFPPVQRHNMPAFKDLLAGIARAWKEEPDEIARVSDQVSGHLQVALSSEQANDTTFTQNDLEAVVKSLSDSYDWGYGGWGAAPKFPQPMTIEFLLRRHMAGNAEALKPVVHVLNAMSRGGMYDVVGGGFSRYSVDNFWRVPHFEKMLYDNAQLARAYLHAWQITKEPHFKQIVIETLDFVARELTHPAGGFYSSLDADSEGEEGKFYVWTLEEIRDVLKEDPEFFEAAYGITPRGNWEGKTVLQRALDDASLAARFNLDPQAVPAQLADSHARLLSARASRVRPGTDDKVLTAWNGLMLATVAEASRALDDSDLQHKYLVLATRSAEFLLDALRPAGQLKRSWRQGKVTSEVFLEDYAGLILGLIELYQTDFQDRWFTSAQELAEEMIELFNDPKGGFFDTSKNSEELLLRPKDLQDNATPSGNALAYEALLKLAAFTDNGKYRDLAEESLGLVADHALRYPTSFGRWLSAADFALAEVKQVAVLYETSPEEAQDLLQTIQSTYRPNTIVAASSYPPSDDAPPLLLDRPLKDGQATAYVCEGFVCRMPVNTILDLQGLL